MTTYYVATTGNDTHTGTISQPFATISYAATVAGPGDTVMVQSGTYTDNVYTSISGTLGASITFQSVTPFGAKVVVGGGGNQAFEVLNDYVDIIGFDISGLANPNAYFGIVGENSHNRYIGNYIHDVPATNSSFGGAGILVSTDAATGVVIAGNKIVNIGNPTDDNGINKIPGLYVQNIGCQIYNNIIVGCSSYAVQCSHGATAINISNNLFLNNHAGVFIGQGGSTNAANCTVNSNIIYYNDYNNNHFTEALQERATVGTGNVYQNNLIYVVPTATYDITMINGVVSGTIVANPRFINYQADGSGDYRLADTSPCIDAGVSSGAPGTDYAGNIRPIARGYDIGPYEMPALIRPAIFQFHS